MMADEVTKIKPMTVYTRLLDGTRLSIYDVRPWDTVDVLKEKIKVCTGYDVAKQRLYCHGRFMEDDYFLTSQGIPEKCRMTQMDLLVVPTGAVDIPVLIDLEDIRNIELPPSYTILEMKERLSFLEGCPIFWFSLTYDGEETDNTRTIKSYGFPQKRGKFEFTTLSPGPCACEEALQQDMKRKLNEDYDKVQAIIDAAARSDEASKESDVIPLPPP